MVTKDGSYEKLLQKATGRLEAEACALFASETEEAEKGMLP